MRETIVAVVLTIVGVLLTFGLWVLTINGFMPMTSNGLAFLIIGTMIGLFDLILGLNNL